MRDDMTDLQWIVSRLNRALQHVQAIPDDIPEQDGLRLTGTLMRLDRVRELLEDGWRTLQSVYDDVSERDRILGADRTVGGPSSGGEGVVADVLRAAAAGFRPAGSDHDCRKTCDTDVACR
jgi:hypothetical protein